MDNPAPDIPLYVVEQRTRGTYAVWLNPAHPWRDKFLDLLRANCDSGGRGLPPDHDWSKHNASVALLVAWWSPNSRFDYRYDAALVRQKKKEDAGRFAVADVHTPSPHYDPAGLGAVVALTQWMNTIKPSEQFIHMLATGDVEEMEDCHELDD